MQYTCSKKSSKRSEQHVFRSQGNSNENALSIDRAFLVCLEHFVTRLPSKKPYKEGSSSFSLLIMINYFSKYKTLA